MLYHWVNHVVLLLRYAISKVTQRGIRLDQNDIGAHKLSSINSSKAIQFDYLMQALIARAEASPETA
jgi:hypothetical protein